MTKARLTQILCLLIAVSSPAFAQTTGGALPDELVFFQSPDGNISCLIALGEYADVRCDIADYVPTHTAPPPNCDLDWGGVFTISEDDSSGQLGCVGDTIGGPGGRKLGYGETETLWKFSCTSEKTGMTCTNSKGHGFTVSKAKQTLF
jgi:hypothetical protein